MRIVEIEDFFHPNTGYQVNILSKYFARQGHEVIVVCSEMEHMPPFLTSFFDISNLEKDDKCYEKSTGVKIIRLPIYKYISGRSIYKSKIFQTVDALKPDILFIHADDTAIAIQFLLRIEKKPYALIMDNHQYDMASHNKFRGVFRFFYKMFITPIIIRNKFKIVRLLEDDYYVQNHFNIPLDLCPYISYGTDTLLFHPDKLARERFRKRYGISDDAIVFLYAGKMDEYKGGLLLAEAIKKDFASLVNKELVFLIIGNTVGDYGTQVEEILSASENRIVRFPTQKYMDLAEFFQAADVGMIPKECSLIFYDYQACALPVISEDNEVNVNRTICNNGFTFTSGDVDDFRDKIIKTANLDEVTISEMKSNALKYAKEGFDYADKARDFEKLMIEEIDRQERMKNKGSI